MQAVGQLEANAFSIFDSQAEPVEGVDLEECWRVWNIMEEKFVSAGTSTEDVTQVDLLRGAIDGLVDSYDDPYSVYRPPTEAEKFEQDISARLLHFMLLFCNMLQNNFCSLN